MKRWCIVDLSNPKAEVFQAFKNRDGALRAANGWNKIMGNGKIANNCKFVVEQRSLPSGFNRKVH